MATIFPANIDNTQSLPVVIDLVTPITGSTVNNLRAAIIQIERALGTNPASTYSTVSNRLDNIQQTSLVVIGAPVVGQTIVWNGNAWSPGTNFGNQNIQTSGELVSGPASIASISTGLFSLSGKLIVNAITTGTVSSPGQGIIYFDMISNQFLVSQNGGSYQPLGSGNLGGDVTGPTASNTVVKLQGTAVSSTVPSAGQVLEFDGSQWSPTATSSGFTAGGDLSGTSSNQTVVGVQTHPVATTAPVNLAVLIYDTANTRYDVRTLTADDIQAGFSINSFVGISQTVELGVTVTNPTFSASYSAVPASATLTNNGGHDSPLSLFPSPFTSGTITGGFTSGANTTVTIFTFTLSATGSSTKTANQTINYEPRNFGGVGTGGAVSASAAGTTALLNASLGTLNSIGPSGGLFSNPVGSSFGPFSPSAQAIYLMFPHTGSAHVFHDQNGFLFPMNAPINFFFTNAHGVANVSMDLYQSTNVSLSTPFTLTVIS